ncbi:MAG: metallophosphoesterase [Thermoflexales bacterium]
MQSASSLRAKRRTAPLFVHRLVDYLFASSVVVAASALLVVIAALGRGELVLALGFLAVAALAGVGVRARFVVPFRIHVTRHDMTSIVQAHTARKPVRVCFFSDLHLGEYKRADWAQRVVDAVLALSPDVILIGGDLVGLTDCCDLVDLLAPLAKLRAPQGVFAVLGNHDYGLPGPDHSEELLRLLPNLGIRVLRNECVSLGDRLLVVGVDELWANRDDVPRALRCCMPAQAPVIILGHNPDLLLRMEQQRSPHWPTPLICLFGHTHHGQIYLPWLWRLTTPIRSRYCRGLYHSPLGWAYVSSGVGENTTPTRLNTKPEIVLLEL